MIQKCFIYMEISLYFLVRLKKNLHLRGRIYHIGKRFYYYQKTAIHKRIAAIPISVILNIIIFLAKKTNKLFIISL